MNASRFGFVMLAVLGVLAFIAPFLDAPIPPGCCAAPPSTGHPFGTTAGGADLLTSVARGLSTTAFVCVFATLFALAFGVAWGSLAATLPPRAGAALMRAVDALAAAPYTLFVITLIVIVRAARPSLPEALASSLDTRFLLVLCVASIEWLTLARVVHARIAALQRRPFVETARSLGVPRRVILARHVAPHTVRPLVAYGVLALPSALAAEGFFSFLGFGVERPHVSLGTLIADGVTAMSVAPWTFVLPASVLVAATVALHVAGAQLRDSLRPERPQ
jgi:ABC-type dipeptide/oligopeptide/nickel transport system permease subunit